MGKNNIKDHEYPDDLSATIGRTKHLQICTEPNDIEGLYYFKVYDRYDSSKYCRISMTNTAYIDAEDETLRLTKEEIQELVDFFNQETRDVQGNSLGISNWNFLIEDNNLEAGSEDSSMYIKEDLKMPDYTKLNPGL